MSQAYEPLEAELRALKPLEPSPELRQRIAQHLVDLPASRPRRIRWIALGGVAAAILVAVVVYMRGGGAADSQPHLVHPGPAPPVPLRDSTPTLLAYERALARSPEEFDARLNQDCLVASQSNHETLRIGAFTRSDAVLHELLGDD